MLAGLGALSFIVAFVAVRVLLSRFGRFALDEPNERSLHQRPVPRTGGVAVLLGASAAMAFGAADLWLPAGLALALGALSFFDDLYGLPTAARLAAHLGAAGLLVWYVLSPMAPLEMALLVIALAWITNLYNFMDGSDGLAGGMAVIGFGAYGVAAALGGNAALAGLCVAIAAAAAAFLAHNVHPARIFLGDVGSIPLGFLAGALGIVGWRGDLWPLWFPVLVFGPFIADATITLVKRALRGTRVWQAHREHYYQRMVMMGLGHRATALAGYGLMLVCAAAALAGRNQAPWLQAVAFFGASALLGVMAIWVDLRWSRFTRGARGPA
jgi:UDP-N-acetylmuramyl pentapeptide phosphotransferase/UDP-N-acetylglucosamine-1-phosphate transferase